MFCACEIILHTPWSRVLLEKLTCSHVVKKLPTFHVTRRFITAFTSFLHMSLSWASSIQSIPLQPTSWRSISVLSSHLGLGLPSGFFPSGFPTKSLHTLRLSLIRATCPAYRILLDFITRTILGEEYRSLSSSLCSFLHSPVTSSLLGPNILLSTLFSNTLSLRSSLNVSNQVSHPYKTIGKIIAWEIIRLFSLVFCMVRTVLGFHFRLVTNETPNKLGPLARRSCSDKRIMFLAWPVCFSRFVVGCGQVLYPRCAGQLSLE